MCPPGKIMQIDSTLTNVKGASICKFIVKYSCWLDPTKAGQTYDTSKLLRWYSKNEAGASSGFAQLLRVTFISLTDLYKGSQLITHIK